VSQILSGLSPARLEALETGYAALVAARRRATLFSFAVLALVLVLSAAQSEVDIGKFIRNLGNFTSYVARIFQLESGKFVLADPVEWFWGWKPWGRLLIETLLIAYVGTLLGLIGGFTVSFLASANLTRQTWLRFAARRYLEFCRTVPELVFALVFVMAFGLGPIPGVLAIAIHTTGALGKLFAEVIENIDMKPVEGVIASGGSWTEQIRFAVLPQVLSNFASYTLLRFEVNVRGAAVMGFVGAGGIGHELLTSIRRFQYPDISALLVTIVVTVIAIDLLTERLRHSLLSEKRS
jgi:phosphonate transport system permease protein